MGFTFIKTHIINRVDFVQICQVHYILQHNIIIFGIYF